MRSTGTSSRSTVASSGACSDTRSPPSVELAEHSAIIQNWPKGLPLRLRSAAMPPELVRISGVAEILDVRLRTAARLSKRDDFPKPIAEPLITGRVWRKADIEKWKRKPPV